jgi:hypothetical protein
MVIPVDSWCRRGWRFGVRDAELHNARATGAWFALGFLLLVLVVALLAWSMSG